MAKQVRTNSITSAIAAVTTALRLESIPNPTDKQLEQIHQAKVKAADVIDNSNFVTMGENADDAIAAQHQADEAAATEHEAEVAAADAAQTAIEDADDGPPLEELENATEQPDQPTE